jgi:outer membrane receptor protein involved in Fe transport
VDAQTTEFFDDFQGPAPAGTELPGSSPVSGSALLLWAYPLADGQFSATLSYTYQNRNYNNLAHTYEHPPLELLGASANLSMPSWPGAPVFSLIGSNLTNEFKPAVVFDTPNTGGILSIFNPPRSFRLGVEFTIGDI